MKFYDELKIVKLNGNGAHVILPKALVGDVVRVSLVDKDFDKVP